MTAYGIVLFLHSSLRWLVLIVSVLLCARSFTAWRNRRSWEPADERLHVALVATFDTQLALGLLLYIFLSPLLWTFFANLSADIKDPTLRFFGLEHEIAMLAATTIVHIGRARSKRAMTDTLRHRSVWITTLLALLLLIVAIPWPGLPHGRPLLRGLTAAIPEVRIG